MFAFLWSHLLLFAKIVMFPVVSTIQNLTVEWKIFTLLNVRVYVITVLYEIIRCMKVSLFSL